MPHPTDPYGSKKIGNHYFACWCSVKGQPGMLPTGWETGNTYWRHLIRRNGRFILNIESQSECYYYEFYCCTPITVLAVYLLGDVRTWLLPSNRLLSVVTFHSICDYDWALSSKIQRPKYTYHPRNFTPRTPGLIESLWISSVEVTPQNPVLSEKTWLYLSKRSAYLGILVIQPASIFFNLLIFLLPKSQRSYITDLA